MNDPAGREQLFNLGVRTVPVLARGEQFIFCQNLEDVAEFVGVQGTGHTPLAPEILLTKWLNVLRAAQRYIRQIPDERLTDRVIDNRDRSIRLMSHHIFRIAEAFLETAIEDVEYWVNNANVPPAEGTCTTGAEIVSYGDQMIARVEKWLGSVGRQVLPAKGPHVLWHAADAPALRALHLALGATHAAIDRNPGAFRHRAQWAAKHEGPRRLAAAGRIVGIGEGRR